MSLLFTIVVLMLQRESAASDYIEQTYKRWLPNINFNNPDNWNLDRLPCPNDRIWFPQTAPPVYVNDASVRELVLPTNGELILDSDMILSFSARTNDASCPGDDIKFNRTQPGDWFDPDNWCFAKDLSGECMASQPPALVTSRIPAQFDSVVLPKHSSFLVNVGGFVDVFINSLSIAGKAFSSKTFSEFRQSPSGKKQFVGEVGANMTKFIISNQPCDDVTGCASGNEAGHIMQHVCDIQSSRCPNISCPNPMLPDGACCRMCGAMIQVEYKKGFSLSDFRSMVLESVSHKSDKTVEKIVCKMSDGTIHIILTDINGGKDGEAIVIAKSLMDKLKTDMGGEQKYKIATVTLLTSERPQTAPLITDKRISSSSIIGIVLSIITVILAVAVAMYCLVDRGRCNISWTFTRFGRNSDKADNLELHGGTGMVRLQFPDFIEDEMQGIDNPVYDVPQLKSTEQTNLTDPDILDPSQVSFVCDSEKGFNNPLFEHEEGIDPTLHINPAYSTEYKELDSEC